jgi:hypothetical protein
MATRWRGKLAPINKPTGDGRRIAPGGFTNRPLPLPLKWQRTDESGHTSAVVIGSMDKLDIAEDAVGRSELFDDASPTATPPPKMSPKPCTYSARRSSGRLSTPDQHRPLPS